jgi:hypothetical protein
MRTPATVAASAVVAALALGACGGGSKKAASGNDTAQIVNIIKSYSDQPTKLCTTYATDNLIRRQFASRARCLAAASSPKAKDPGVIINSLKISGDHAAVIDTDTSPGAHNSKALVQFVKTSQGWMIDSIIPVR